MQQAIVKLKQLNKIYHQGLVEVKAVDNITLEIDKGDFAVLCGPSGSGKTTFLNIAGLLEEISQGKYMLDGVDVVGLKDKELSRLRNEKIGFIFQSFNLIPDLNLFENVDVPLRYRGFSAKERKRRIEEALEKVGLAARMKHLPAQLSGGQQQRVAIARALAGEPKFLLADEPTGNLDSLMARQVMDLLKDINKQGTTIVMVTHDPALARSGQRNIQIVDGQVCDFSQFNRQEFNDSRTVDDSLSTQVNVTETSEV